MRSYMKHAGGHAGFNGNGTAQVSFADDDVSLVDIAREEHTALTGLIAILKCEREAVLSHSFKDITKTNREKEEVLRTLARLRERRESRFGRRPDRQKEKGSAEYLALAGTIMANMREAQKYIRRNRVLLSLSAGRIRSVMDFLARSLKDKPATYGGESKQGPVFLSRRV